MPLFMLLVFGIRAKFELQASGCHRSTLRHTLEIWVSDESDRIDRIYTRFQSEFLQPLKKAKTWLFSVCLSRRVGDSAFV